MCLENIKYVLFNQCFFNNLYLEYIRVNNKLNSMNMKIVRTPLLLYSIPNNILYYVIIIILIFNSVLSAHFIQNNIRLLT